MHYTHGRAPVPVRWGLARAALCSPVDPPAGCGEYQAGLACANGGQYAAACAEYVPCALTPPG